MAHTNDSTEDTTTNINITDTDDWAEPAPNVMADTDDSTEDTVTIASNITDTDDWAEPAPNVPDTDDSTEGTICTDTDDWAVPVPYVMANADSTMDTTTTDDDWAVPAPNVMADTDDSDDDINWPNLDDLNDVDDIKGDDTIVWSPMVIMGHRNSHPHEVTSRRLHDTNPFAPPYNCPVSTVALVWESANGDHII